MIELLRNPCKASGINLFSWALPDRNLTMQWGMSEHHRYKYPTSLGGWVHFIHTIALPSEKTIA